MAELFVLTAVKNSYRIDIFRTTLWSHFCGTHQISCKFDPINIAIHTSAIASPISRGPVAAHNTTQQAQQRLQKKAAYNSATL